MCAMEKIRPILYGVADYAEMRKANAWFIDRTAKIRDLEATRYAIFLRPRRFGKSLLASILEAYYDVRYADRLIEMKYVKAGDPAPTPEQLAKIKVQAIDQPVIGVAGVSPVTGTTGILPVETGTTGVPPVANGQDARSPSSSVTLHRLVLVFHGGECVLSEAV